MALAISTVIGSLLLATAFILSIRYLSLLLFPQAIKKSTLDLSTEPTALAKRFAAALPNITTLPHDTAAFLQSTNAYWAQQECEVVPACVVRPRNTADVCTAIRVLKQEYDSETAVSDLQGRAQPIFAVRSGGHSPVPGAATISQGVVIDLSLLKEIIPSADGTSVSVGAGAKWSDVSKALDQQGFAVVGGRSSAVGTGGLTLGGIHSRQRLFPSFPRLIDHLQEVSLIIRPALALSAITSWSMKSSLPLDLLRKLPLPSIPISSAL